jgi:hypothetical protein
VSGAHGGIERQLPDFHDGQGFFGLPAQRTKRYSVARAIRLIFLPVLRATIFYKQFPPDISAQISKAITVSVISQNTYYSFLPNSDARNRHIAGAD